jgi:hypothetical protein
LKIAHQQAIRLLSEYCLADKLKNDKDYKPTIDELTEFLQNEIFPESENYLTGGFIRFEDSPGNYLIRFSKQRLEYTMFDLEGGESIQTIPLPVPKAVMEKL